jgi:hypothetical protein
MRNSGFDLLSSCVRAAVLAVAMSSLIPTSATAGPVWRTQGEFCQIFSEGLFNDSSSFVAIPSCVGAGTIGLPLVVVVVLPTSLLVRGLAYPWGSGREAAGEIESIWGGRSLAIGAALIGGPFFLLKKAAWDAPQALIYLPS